MKKWPGPLEAVCGGQAIPILIPLLVGAGTTGSAAVRTPALVVGDKKFKELSTQANIDLGHLENSISHLEAQVDSLAEVFPRETRCLCMALGETCCFRANQSGVIRECLAIARNNTEKREKRCQESNQWYRSLLSWAHWITTHGHCWAIDPFVPNPESYSAASLTM